MRTRFLPMAAAVVLFSLGVIPSRPQVPVTRQSDAALSSRSAVVASVDASLASYRKIIVLMDNASALDEGNRERVRTAAWILFEKNRDRLDELEQSLRADGARNESPLVNAFLDRLESDTDLRDADKLAAETAAAANDEGMRLYKEKLYADSAGKFVEATGLHLKSALYSNNPAKKSRGQGRVSEVP